MKAKKPEYLSAAFVDGPYDPAWNPVCSTCGTGRMHIEQSGIRTPERWLRCDNEACGRFEDVTIEQYYNREPAPDWFTQGTFRPRKDVTQEPAAK